MSARTDSLASVWLALLFIGFLLVADEWGGVDLLDQRVVVAAHSPTDSILSLWTAVVETVLYHEVHWRSSMEIVRQVLKVIQYVRVLERGSDTGKRKHEGSAAEAVLNNLTVTCK